MGGKQSKGGGGEFSVPKVKTWSSGLHLNFIHSKENVSSSSRTYSRKLSGSLRHKTRWPIPHVDAAFLPEYRLLPGKDLENYEVLDVIAAGSYGNVLKGIKVDEKRLCAIKLINKSRVLVEGTGSIQQCKDEVAIQELVGKYAFTVELLHYWQTRKRLYLVLEYVSGGELFSVWKMIGAMSERLVRFYLAEIALALDYIHHNEIVYRDLKLENILLDSEGHVKVIDFGLAKWLPPSHRTNTICGTLQYTAPEVLAGGPYGHSADWWSLGVLGFALLTGRFPLFGAKGHREMREMVLHHSYPIPDALSDAAAHCLTQLLQKDPYRRLRGVSVMQALPFFHGEIDLQRLERKQYEPSSFFTADDLSRVSLDSTLGLWLARVRPDFPPPHRRAQQPQQPPTTTTLSSKNHHRPVSLYQPPLPHLLNDVEEALNSTRTTENSNPWRPSATAQRISLPDPQQLLLGQPSHYRREEMDYHTPTIPVERGVPQIPAGYEDVFAGF